MPRVRSARSSSPPGDAPLADLVASGFSNRFGRPPTGVWAAPGRVNLIGEHTDHNDGFVLPLALTRRTWVAAAPSTSGRTTVCSRQRPGEAVEFAAATVGPGAVTGWGAYPAGAAWALRTSLGLAVDVEVLVHGDVPEGAGLASSAALGCAVAVALADLAGATVDRTVLARLVQRAENEFVGVPTGIMDPVASLHGRRDALVFLDARSLAVELIDAPLAAQGLALLVLDTGTPHRLADGAYAARRRSCEAAARCLGVPALRDVDARQLDEALAELPHDEARRRVRHVVTEDERVLEVVAALRSRRDLRAIGPVLTASHASLRDDFEVSTAALDATVAAALDAGAHGARLTGGGFGGSGIALVDIDRAPAVAAAVVEVVAEAGLGRPSWFTAEAGDGAGRVR